MPTPRASKAYQRKSGRWYIYVWNAEGKRSNPIYGATKAEVLEKAGERLAAMARGEFADPSKKTVAQWIDEWIPLYGIPSWDSEDTKRNYQDSLRNKTVPAFGKIKLQALTTNHIQKFILDSCKSYSVSTVRLWLVPFKAAIQKAVKLGYIGKNPMDGIEWPKATPQKREAFTEEELQAYLAHLPDTTSGRVLQFVVRTGLRIGEALALCWEDIDEKSIHIRRTVILGGKALQDHPKTTSSVRDIPISSSVRALLQKQRTEQNKRILELGEPWGLTGVQPPEGCRFVFTTSSGAIVKHNNVTEVHKATIKAAGVNPKVTLHGLRHTFCTMAVKKGSDIGAASRIMGHSKTSITMDIYYHPERESLENVMQAVSDIG